ncbi:hypothetical protein J7K93_00190 [bacterium]|nr:hypothetical protein [bacterium]
MKNTLIILAELHYEFGLIGYDEFNERIKVALWLNDEVECPVTDPRDQYEEDVVRKNNETTENEELSDSVVSTIDGGETNNIKNEDNWLEFLCLGIWVFTKADPDSYPSIPHGHYKSQTRQWPKLNPYTGRVFATKHQEDKAQRLTKKQMKIIWTDEKFKSFCRGMIVWYQEQFPYYEFSVRRPLRMPRW